MICIGKLAANPNLKWNKSDRIEYLRKHPAMAARLFAIKQKCIWENLIMGTAEPFGEIVDYWIRVEFQSRGTAHSHSMVCCKHKKGGVTPEMMTSTNSEDQEKIKDHIKQIITAKLTVIDDSLLEGRYCDKAVYAAESDFHFNPDNNYFDDENDPRRRKFDATLNYDQHVDDNGNVIFADARVAVAVRDWQLASQMHRCCFTCWKYLAPWVAAADKVCRFFFPWKPTDSSESDVTIIKDRDPKSRVRVRALPPRDNAYLNVHSVWGQINLAAGGNVDCQYISNKVGAAEYISSYIGKTDDPDTKTIRNKVYQSLAKQALASKCIDDKAQLRTVGQAHLSWAKVGTIQCCYFLLGLKTVFCTRVVESINALHRSQIHLRISNPNSRQPMNESNNGDEIPDEDSESPHDCLQEQQLESDNTSSKVLELPASSNALDYSSIGSHLGKRNCYAQLMVQQFALLVSSDDAHYANMITLHALLTSFTLQMIEKKTSKKLLLQPPLFQLDNDGFVLDDQLYTYALDDYILTPRRRRVVLNMSPSIPVDASCQRSAYSTLLLHIPWLVEADIVNPFDDPVAKLNDLEHKQMIPKHVNVHRNRRQASETLIANVGNIDGRGGDDHDMVEVPSDGFYDPDGENIMYEPPVVQNFATGISQNLTADEVKFYSNFVRQAHGRYMDEYANDNQYSPDSCSAEQLANIFQDGGIRVDSWDDRKETLAELYSGCTSGQKEAFDGICANLNKGGFSATCVSGDAGVGKSHLVRLLQEHCRLKFGKTVGTFGPSVVLGPTGCASNNVKGFTWQGALGVGLNLNLSQGMSLGNKVKIGKKLQGVKLVIIDEMSMISAKDLHEIEMRIKQGNSFRCIILVYIVFCL